MGWAGGSDATHDKRVASVAERAWAKVEKRGPDECWGWTGATGQKGQPQMSISKRTVSVRRIIWEDVHGEELLKTRQVSTTCKEAKCLNPAHFFLRAFMDHEARFWGFVEKAEGDACWEWKSTFFASGYAAFGMDGKERHASRVAWEFTYGPIEGHVPGHPELEVCVCHRCDNPKCVRPDHLFLGHDRDNIADMHAKGRESRGPEHVKKIRETMAEKAAKREAERRDPTLLSKPMKTAWLVGAGWKIERKRGEPMWFFDPEGVWKPMRVDDAFSLQLRRERNQEAASA